MPGRFLAVLALLGALAVAVPAVAHHGWSGYDTSKELTLTGTIKEAGYEHPHAALAAQVLWTGVIACGRLLAYV